MKYTEETYDKIAELAGQGLTYDKIASELSLGCKGRSLYKQLERNGRLDQVREKRGDKK